MKRDIELERKILFKIEEVYEPGRAAIWSPEIDGYDLQTTAEHCDFLYQQGLIKSYKPTYADTVIQGFHVGNITVRGYEYLELIRNNDVWEKTKTEIDERKLPMTLEVVAKIAGTFIGNVIKELNG